MRGLAENAPSTGQYAAATETLRSTARWLLAAFAGVGAILVAGLQLTGLGKLDWLRLAVAVVALAAATGAVAYMMTSAAQVLTMEWVSLAHFDNDVIDAMLRRGRWQGLDRDELIDIGHQIDDLRDELYGHVASDVGALHRQLEDTNARAVRIAAGTEQATARDRAEVGERVWELRAAAREVVDYANFERTRRLFTQLRGRLARGAIVILVSVTVFAYAANPPRADKPIKVEIVPGRAP